MTIASKVQLLGTIFGVALVLLGLAILSFAIALDRLKKQIREVHSMSLARDRALVEKIR